MGSLLRFVEVVFRPSCDNILLMLQVILEHIKNVHDLRLIVHEGEHDHTERILKLCMLIQLVQDDIRVHIAPQFNTDPHSLSAGLVTQVCDSVNLFISHKLRDLLDEPCLIHHKRQLGHDDPVLAVVHRLDVCDRAHTDLSASGPVSLLDSSCPEDLRPCGEIRSFDDLQYFLNGGLSLVLDLIVDDPYHRSDDLPQIMRRDIRRHTDRDTGCTVYEKIRKSGRKHSRLLLRLVKVGGKINGILVDVRRHLHGDPAQTRLCITHRRSAVAVHGTEVSMTVHERISCRPFLRKIDKSSVDGAVSVGMIFTHCITDDTRALTMRFVGTVVQFDHGVEDPSLHRLQAVPHIREGTGSDNAHGIIDVGNLHRFFQVYLMDFIKNIIFHCLSPFRVFPAPAFLIFR